MATVTMRDSDAHPGAWELALVAEEYEEDA